MAMNIASHQLLAFAEVARVGNFSSAARNLHITQSALSQRILNLESFLNVSLFLRDQAGVKMTHSGEELYRYCLNQKNLEAEVLAKLSLSSPENASLLRIGSYSSLTRSLVIPRLTEIVTENSHIKIELYTRELNELNMLLKLNKVDYIFQNSESQFENISSILIGYEENVLIEGATCKRIKDIYLDHDADDMTTFHFFKSQKKPQSEKINRGFLDEIYSIIDAVSLGWGRAVVPKHLVASNRKIHIRKDFKPVKVPIYLHFYQQNHYSSLHNLLLESFRSIL